MSKLIIIACASAAIVLASALMINTSRAAKGPPIRPRADRKTENSNTDKEHALFALKGREHRTPDLGIQGVHAPSPDPATGLSGIASSGSVHVTVLAANGTKRSGATVTIASSFEATAHVVSGLTDENGEFTFTGLNAGDWSVFTSCGVTEAVQVALGEERHVRLIQQGETSLRISVVDADGTPVGHADLLTTPVVTLGTSRVIATTNSEGIATVDGLSKWSWVMARKHGQGQSSWISVKATLDTPEDRRLLAITVLPYTTSGITGRALSMDGQPVAGALLCCRAWEERANGGWRNGLRDVACEYAESDQQGHFLFGGVTAGHARVDLIDRRFAPNFAVSSTDRFGSTDCGVITAAPPARLIGRVVDAERTEPRVEVLARGFKEFTASTDAGLGFYFDRLPTGSCVLFLLDGQKQVLRERITLSAGEEASWYPSCANKWPLILSVAGQSGANLAGAAFSLRNSSSRQVVLEGVLDTDGEITFDVPSGHEYELELWTSGAEDVVFGGLTPRQRPHMIRVYGGASSRILGRLPGLSGATVAVTDRGKSSGYRKFFSRTKNDYSFEIATAGISAARLNVILKNGAPGPSLDIDIVPGMNDLGDITGR